MNPLVTLVAMFASLRTDLTKQFNKALEGRPPLESVEGANVAASVLREIDWAKDRIERMGTELSTTLSNAATIIPGFDYRPGEAVEAAAARMLEKISEQAGMAAISNAIAAKTHLPMEDHRTALDDAVNNAKEVVRGELQNDFNAKLDEMKLIAERRNAAVEKLGSAANSLSDEDLLAEDHEARLGRVEERITTLAAAGITPELKPLSFTSLMACGMDEAGTKEFTARLETLKEAGALPVQASGPMTTAPKKPSTPVGSLPSGDGSTPKKVVI